MDKARRLGIARGHGGGQLPDEGNREIAGSDCGLRKRVAVNDAGIAADVGDHGRGRGRDHAAVRFGARERGLHGKHALHRAGVGENVQHGRAAGHGIGKTRSGWHWGRWVA
ncbi:hypothetical protein D3C72_2053150 [compost metagenome]